MRQKHTPSQHKRGKQSWHAKRCKESRVMLGKGAKRRLHLNLRLKRPYGLTSRILSWRNRIRSNEKQLEIETRTIKKSKTELLLTLAVYYTGSAESQWQKLWKLRPKVQHLWGKEQCRDSEFSPNTHSLTELIIDRLILATTKNKQVMRIQKSAFNQLHCSVPRTLRTMRRKELPPWGSTPHLPPNLPRFLSSVSIATSRVNPGPIQ